MDFKFIHIILCPTLISLAKDALRGKLRSDEAAMQKCRSWLAAATDPALCNAIQLVALEAIAHGDFIGF